MAKPPRTRRRNGADWVYRSTVWDTAAGALDDLGTYTPVQKVLVAGIANANFGALYDSFNYARVQSPRALRPSTRRASASTGRHAPKARMPSSTASRVRLF